MNHNTHQSPELVVTTEPLFSPTPGTHVSISSTFGLPARVSLLTRSERRHGLMIVCVVFNACLTSAQRVEALKHSGVLSAGLGDRVAEEIVRRVEEVAR